MSRALPWIRLLLVTIVVHFCKGQDNFSHSSVGAGDMTTDDPGPDVGGPDPDGCAEETGYVEFRLPGCGCCGGCGCNVTCQNCGDPGGKFYPGENEYIEDEDVSEDDDSEDGDVSDDRQEGPGEFTTVRIVRPGVEAGSEVAGKSGNSTGKPDKPTGKPPGKPPGKPGPGCCEKWPGDDIPMPMEKRYGTLMKSPAPEVCVPRENCCTGKIRVTTWFIPPGCNARFKPGPSTKIIPVFDDFGLIRERAVIFNDGETWQVVFKDRFKDPPGEKPPKEFMFAQY